MRHRLRRELRLLRAHALVTTPLVVVLSLSAFRQSAQNTRFTEIDVERINVVEPDGKLPLVISNRPRSIGPIYKGKPFGYPGGTRPGMIFFNDEGMENGGLTDVNIFDLVAERDSINRLADGPAKTAALQRWREPRNVGRDSSAYYRESPLVTRIFGHWRRSSAG